ncbi:SusC/RagA family TonB-linked outer membrane protein [Arcticibacter sp. MXS-1]|uniref:SusC/RagA family TonB-linked outer membrane protein n=1 Tax=Arcticibacter sp. MXS-1 TaxID=3341726 RepID=UPI0035A83A25
MTKLYYFLMMIVCLSVQTAYSQNRRISGTVTDAKTGEPLIGVSVKVKGTNTGASTDAAGSFTVTVTTPGATLLFSYMGYQPQEVPAWTQARLNIKMTSDTKALDEVVVVGYGTMKRAQVATAVGSVTGQAIAERGTVNPLQGVQGQVAGVDISQGSGRAGAGFNVQIRGQNSLAGSQPLYVVDGVIVPDINFLNPQDIAKMDVLKDAAATAIYGSRGSNGVIIVSTKGGASVKGGPTLSYDGYVGIRSVTSMPNFMTGDQWWEFRQNAYISPELLAGRTNYDNTIGSFNNPTILQRVADKEYTDWQDLVIKRGIQSNHWLTASGVSDNGKIRYVIGAGYQNEKGNFLQETFDRYNIKSSVESDLNKYWTAGLSLNYSISEMERGSDVGIRNAFAMAPIFKPYDEQGNLVFRPGQIPVNANTTTSVTSTVNPLLEIPNTENNTRRNFGVANLFLQFAPAPWLSLRSSFQPSVSNMRNGRFWGSLTTEGDGLLPDAQRVNQQTFSYILDNMITVKKDIKDHSFNFTGLYSIQKDRFEQDSTRVNDLPFNSSYHNLGSSSNRQKATSEFSQFSLMSYMARLNYSYKNRYFITLVNRWDGASRLAEGNKWASFPSVALAWQMGDEDFIKKYTFISDLKLRLSAGKAGNNNGVQPYGTQATLGSPSFYDYGGTLGLGYAPGRLPNVSLTWERTREYDLGLDYGFLRGKISGSVDVYDKRSEGLILNRLIPVENGYTSIVDNVSSVSNKGIELSLRTVNISTPKFSWTTSFTFSRNKNAIIELLNGKQDMVGNKWFIGKPINVNYTYIYDGIWVESERAQAADYGQFPGQAKVRDVNNDGKISSTDDRAIIGQKDPKWTGGFSTQLTWKAFDLSASLFARQGMQIFSPFHSQFGNYADRGTMKVYYDYYMSENKVTPTRTSTAYPMPNNVGPYWSGIAGVGYYKDVSFVKVQNISLGYTLPAGIVKQMHIKGLRVYANVLNPFVWTKFDGFDPEGASGVDPNVNPWDNNNNSGGSLNNLAPSTVTYQFGVNLKF